MEQLLQQMSDLARSLRSQPGGGCELVVASSLWTKDLLIKPEYAAASLTLFQVHTLMLKLYQAWTFSKVDYIVMPFCQRTSG